MKKFLIFLVCFSMLSSIVACDSENQQQIQQQNYNSQIDDEEFDEPWIEIEDDGDINLFGVEVYDSGKAKRIDRAKLKNKTISQSITTSQPKITDKLKTKTNNIIQKSKEKKKLSRKN